MKKYKYKVTTTVTGYVEVEADNEEDARRLADDEIGDTKVSALNDLGTDFDLLEVTERCDYCYEEFDCEIEPLVDYDGGRYCECCRSELEESKGE